MTAEGFGLSRIRQIHVSVKDVDRSVKFYRDVLGMKFLFQFPGMAFFDCDGVRLYLAVPERPEFDRTSLIYYSVSSIQDAVKALEGRSVKFHGRPHIVHQDGTHELWVAFFQDPDANGLALMSEVPKG
jgi:methylmalonyl-CoA/ethylmalonyl-CoA epimerase